MAFARFGPAFRRWMSTGVSTTSFPRLRLLRVLLTEGPQTMGALSQELGVTPRNITVLVDGLEGEGLAERHPHPKDRRATIVALTDAGRTVVTEAFGAHVERVSVLFERLSPSEQATLLTLINKLADELASLGASGVCAPGLSAPDDASL